MMSDECGQDEQLLDELDECVEGLEDIEAAEDFRESLREKAASMREWFEQYGDLTEAQGTAIGNMIAGARRWLERRR